MASLHVFVGTARGLFCCSSDEWRRDWQVTGPFLGEWEISSVHIDRASGRLVVGTRHPRYGAMVQASDDRGESWRQVLINRRDPLDEGPAVNQIWEIVPGFRPGELYAGAEDAGLFWSADLGETWEEVPALRKACGVGPDGRAVEGSLVHSIVVDPTEPGRLWVATSTAGVLRSDDRGASWSAMNDGLQCTVAENALRTHKLIRGPAESADLYLQHFEGVYRTRAGDETWRRADTGLPTTFGFPILATPAGDLFAAPLVSFAERSLPNGRLRLYRSSDGGSQWSPSERGLPTSPNFVGVLRDALTSDTRDPVGVYFGTTAGHLFASADGGETWGNVPGKYPRITVIKAQ
ncbi:MAG TPA: hypothetical protein VFZ25_15710 [Chloroflexota bacterium]|nr:hypothetical protein [Chloroflexota bacterium]